MTVKTHEVYAEEWKGLPWKKFQATLFRLQHRIYKAAKKNDKDLIKRLQRLLMGSKCAKYLSVRQVTQLNTGKRTAGVDGVSSLDPKGRCVLADDLGNIEGWKHQKLRRVFIPKSNGSKRPLGIPTIRDRAMQCLLKYALEPVYEAQASHGSYGSRPGHSTWDVQKSIFQNLRSTSNGHRKRVLELDIEKCFDSISHVKLLSLITLPPCGLKVLKTALKAGVLLERESTEQGTPQSGVISPLLANIALQGVEDLHNQKTDGRTYQRGLRYADDMIYFLKEDESSDKLLDKIRCFLSERGLLFQKEKTRLVSSVQGFDFLGWHFKVKARNLKFVSYPSKDNRKNMVEKVKRTMKDTRFKLEERLAMVKTIYRGWFNYHEYSDMTQVNKWSINRWVYKYLKRNSKMSPVDVINVVRSIFFGHTFKAQGFVSLVGGRSVFDNDWLYWSKRNSIRYTGPLLTTLKGQN
jgi:RNA-directed DNA polymerase